MLRLYEKGGECSPEQIRYAFRAPYSLLIDWGDNRHADRLETASSYVTRHHPSILGSANILCFTGGSTKIELGASD
jgi:hypothetical protein